MNVTSLIPVAALAAIVAVSAWSPSVAESSASPGVYTARQAAAGGKLYAAECSACHGANLKGVIAPALIGDAFTSQWTGEPANDAFAMMEKNMPQNAPGTLSHRQALELAAYILERNAYPAGAAPLTTAKLEALTIASPPTAP